MNVISRYFHAIFWTSLNNLLSDPNNSAHSNKILLTLKKFKPPRLNRIRNFHVLSCTLSPEKKKEKTFFFNYDSWKKTQTRKHWKSFEKYWTFFTTALLVTLNSLWCTLASDESCFSTIWRELFLPELFTGFNFYVFIAMK